MKTTVKRSNISKAWKSTMIGIVLGILTATSAALAEGHFSWKSILAGAMPAIIMAVTDFLREVQKDLEPQNTTNE